MAFDDRLQFLLLGMAIGFVLGYLVRLVREIKEELDEVDDIVKKELGNHDRGESGFMEIRYLKDIAILLVVGLTAWASFVSQKASNDSQDTQDRIETVTYCMLTSQSEALNALNERSTYTKEQANANIDLQTDFATFFNLLLHQPPFSSEEQRKAAEKYQTSLNNFVDVSKKTRSKVEDNPFPTVDDLRTCIRKGAEGDQ